MILRDEAREAVARLVLAHGAGAQMDHPWMNDMTARLVQLDVSVARFEFGFMAARRGGGKRRPAPKAETLVAEYVDAVERLTDDSQDGIALYIGGKSLGGRVASLAAAELHAGGRIRGVACLGYPFHPQGRPEMLRTAHLQRFDCPLLIVQGTRDALGSRADVSGYDLDARIEVAWLEDGDHDLKPRRASGETVEGHLAAAAELISAFVREAR